LPGAADVKFPKAFAVERRSGNLKSKSDTEKRGVAGAPRLQSSRREAGLMGFGSGVQGCYKASVNESETINDGKPLSFEAGGLKQPVLRFPVAPFIERS
jgi:hypothetical protein